MAPAVRSGADQRCATSPRTYAAGPDPCAKCGQLIDSNLRAGPPLNYRHAFHAGNFADVLKHAVLVRILVYLRTKPAAFRVIDTHAGAGLYDLAGPEASRSLEWRERHRAPA